MLKANNACSSRAHPKSISLPSSAAIQFCVTLTTNIELEDVVAALTKLDYFDERPILPETVPTVTNTVCPKTLAAYG
jgi:hypothetical protein